MIYCPLASNSESFYFVNAIDKKNGSLLAFSSFLIFFPLHPGRDVFVGVERWQVYELQCPRLPLKLPQRVTRSTQTDRRCVMGNGHGDAAVVRGCTKLSEGRSYPLPCASRHTYLTMHILVC